MAIKRNVKVVITNDVSKLSEAIYVYQNDRGIDLTFDIVENKFTFTGNQSENIIRANEIMYAGLTVKKPDSSGFFRRVLPIEENKVIFRIEREHTDDFAEIGTYQLQIHLYDKFDNRVSIPPFSLEVKPLVADGVAEITDAEATVDYGIVDVSVVGSDKELFVIEYKNGEPYIRTEWKAGDVITASKINNMEAGIERASQALENLEIPSVEGLASEQFVTEAIAEANNTSKEYTDEKLIESKSYTDEAISNIEFPETDLSNYPTKAEVTNEIDTKVSKAKAELEQAIDDIEIPSIEGLAKESYVDSSVNQLNITLKGYTDAQIQNTKAYVDNAINDIEIPSIEGLATENFVNDKVSTAHRELSNAIDRNLTSSKNYTDDAIAKIEIPSVDGLASEEYVDEAIRNIDIPEVDLSSYPTKAEVTDEIAEAKAELNEAVSQVNQELSTKIDDTLDLANDYTDKAIANIPEVDLSDYSTKAEVDTKINEAKAELEQAIEDIEIPSIEGLANKEYVDNKVTESHSSLVIQMQNNLDLANRYTDSAIEDIQIPSIDGLASEDFVREQIENIEFPETDLSDYPTKDEVTTEIGNVKDYVDEAIDSIGSGGGDGFKGAIGVATKYAKLPQMIEDAIPEPPVVSGSEYIGKMIYKYEYSSNSTRYKVLYFYNNPSKDYYPYLYVNMGTGDIAITGYNTGSTYKTMKGYYCEAKATTPTFTVDDSFSLIYVERHATVIYYSDLPVYTDVSKTEIYRNASNGEFIGNFNFANEQGKYSVSVTKSEFLQLQNAPKATITKDRVDTVLHCYKKEGVIFQEIVIEGVTYTRKNGEQWIGLDTTDFIKKDAINDIKGIATVATTSEIDDIYATCPVLDTHLDITGILDFKSDSNKYYRFCAYKSTGNEMFYQYVNGSTTYVGYTATRYFFIKYVYTSGAWSIDTSTNQYINARTAHFEVYQNTLPICASTGYAPNTANKDNIIKEATTGDKAPISDFNMATSYGTYNVSANAGTSILNAPDTDLSFAILTVKTANNVVYHKLETASGLTFKRTFKDDIWSEWMDMTPTVCEGGGIIGGGTEGNADTAKDFVLTPSYYVGKISNKSISSKISLNEINSLRPTHKHRAVAYENGDDMVIGFTIPTSLSTSMYLSSDKTTCVQLNGSSSVFYKKIDGAWVNTTISSNRIVSTGNIEDYIKYSELHFYGINRVNVYPIYDLVPSYASNLDQVWDAGLYRVEFTSAVGSVPDGLLLGTLEVMATGKNVQQTFYDGRDNSHNVYKRHSKGTNWTSWKLVEDANYTSSGTGSDSSIDPSEIEDIRAQLETVNTELTAINNSVTSQATELETVKNTANSANTTANSANTTATNNATEITSIKNTLTSINGAFGNYYNKTEVDARIQDAVDSIDLQEGTGILSTDSTTGAIKDFNSATQYTKYEVYQVGSTLSNAPVSTSIEGILEVKVAGKYITQEFTDLNGNTYVRSCKDGAWYNWINKQAQARPINANITEATGDIKDFNKATADGIYWYSYPLNTTKLSNCPYTAKNSTTFFGILEVISSGKSDYCIQRATSPTSARQLWRVFANGSWTNWEQPRFISETSGCFKASSLFSEE